MPGRSLGPELCVCVLSFSCPRRVISKLARATCVCPRRWEPNRCFYVARTLAHAVPAEYDGAVLPGGVANPDQLRTDERAVRFLQQLFAEGKPWE